MKYWSSVFLKSVGEKPAVAAGLLGLTAAVNVLALTSSIFVMIILGSYVETGFDDTLVTLSTGMLLALLLRLMLLKVRNKIISDMGLSPGEGLWKNLFRSTLGMSSQALERMPTALRMEIMEHVRTLQAAMGTQTTCSMLDAPFILLFLGISLLISPTLGLLGLLFCLPALFMGIAAPRMEYAHAKAMKKASAAGAETMVAAVKGSDMIRAGGAYALPEKRLHGIFEALSLRESLVVVLKERFTSLQQINATACRVLVYAVGAKLCVLGIVSVAELIGASLLISRALAQTSAFTTALHRMQEGEKARRGLTGFFKLPREAGGAAKPKACSGRLEFRDLAFRHRGSTVPLFESLQAECTAGTMMLVHGPSGAGKTTLARMTAGLLSPSRGDILVDGTTLHQIHTEWWRKQFFYMPQEPGFLRGSLRENLTAASSDIPGHLLDKIIGRCGLDPFLSALPGGLDAQVLDGGRGLPPGIRRKLAMARSLVHHERHRPSFAFFDEPLERLDAAGVKLVLSVIRDFMAAGRSVVIFTHEPKRFQGAQVRIDLGVKPKPSVVGGTKPRGFQAGTGA